MSVTVMNFMLMMRELGVFSKCLLKVRCISKSGEAVTGSCFYSGRLTFLPFQSRLL